jgi:hypothetical protein
MDAREGRDLMRYFDQPMAFAGVAAFLVAPSESPVEIQYSCTGVEETQLPERVRLPVLVTAATGTLTVGRQMIELRTEVEKMAADALAYIEVVAEALPHLDATDEKLVDDLVQQKMAGLRSKPLRRTPR